MAGGLNDIGEGEADITGKIVGVLARYGVHNPTMKYHSLIENNK